MEPKVRNVKGELSLAIKGRPHKFCSLCGLMMVADKSKLVRHYRGHHRGEDPSFLKFGAEP